MKESKIIAIGFDGTCVTNEFPNIGTSIGAEEVLKELVANGNRLVLFTNRGSNRKKERKKGGDILYNAVNWFKENDIQLYMINDNPCSEYPKPFYDLYIDDASLGVPLIEGVHDRPFVDWYEVRKILIEQGYIKSDLEKLYIEGDKLEKKIERINGRYI